mmetsp:Transcript_8618/g.35333  ORF Transcript_8618/g.35333 Transcript_8618/m.35333 type:complete len:253 (+) Transcript_8618:461-1219(+)
MRRTPGALPRDPRPRRVRARAHRRADARTLRRGVPRRRRIFRSGSRFLMATRRRRRRPGLPRARGPGRFRRGQALRGHRRRRRRRGHRRPRRRRRDGAPARRRKSRRRVDVHPSRRVGDGGGRRRLRQAQGQGPRRGDARCRDREDRRRRWRGGGGRGGTRVWPAAGTRAHRRGEGAGRPGPAPRPRARRRHPDGFELLGRRLSAAGARVHAAGGDVRHRRRRDDGAARALPARADRATVGRGARLAPKGLG